MLSKSDWEYIQFFSQGDSERNPVEFTTDGTQTLYPLCKMMPFGNGLHKTSPTNGNDINSAINICPDSPRCLGVSVRRLWKSQKIRTIWQWINYHVCPVCIPDNLTHHCTYIWIAKNGARSSIGRYIIVNYFIIHMLDIVDFEHVFAHQTKYSIRAD